MNDDDDVLKLRTLSKGDMIIPVYKSGQCVQDARIVFDVREYDYSWLYIEEATVAGFKRNTNKDEIVEGLKNNKFLLIKGG